MRIIFTVIIAMLLHSNASADYIDRDYIELSVNKQAVSDGSFNGQELVISRAIDDNVYLSWNMEQSNESITTGGGLGVQIETNNNAYLYGGIEYQRRNRDEGALFKLGSYHYIFDNTMLTSELSMAVVNVDIYYAASSEIRYYFNKNTSLGFGVKSEQVDDERKTITSLSLRGGFWGCLL